MAIREYKCSNCGLKFERLYDMAVTPPAKLECPRCKTPADYLAIPSSISIATSNFSQRSFDVAVGADAERRWNDIHERQEKRDKVRQESGQVGLSMVGRNEFAPLPVEDRQQRSASAEVLTREGHKPVVDNETDRVILETRKNLN